MKNAQSDPNQAALQAHLKKLHEDKLQELGQQLEQEKTTWNCFLVPCGKIAYAHQSPPAPYLPHIRLVAS